MRPVLYLALYVIIGLAFLAVIYKVKRDFNDLERGYGWRAPRRHWWQP